MKRTYRILIVLNWATAILGGIVYVATRNYMPVEILLYRERMIRLGVSPFRIILFCVDVILIIVCVINSIGLFRFRKWAKTLLVPLYVIAILGVPTNPVYIETGWTHMVFYISSVIGGMILAMTFFSPLAEVFDRGGDV